MVPIQTSEPGRAARACRTFVLAALALGGLAALAAPSASAADPAPAADAATSLPLSTVLPSKPTSGTLSVERLLADPIPSQPTFRLLRQRREWLARQGGDSAKFEQVAAEFDKLGAYYPALELLWFAEKLTVDDAKRTEYKSRMVDYAKQVQGEAQAVDAAVQLWGAGKPEDSFEKLRGLLVTQPYNELAHYQHGYRTWLAYLMHDREKNGELPEPARAELFRTCYVDYLVTLEIDPLYNDAYYQLGQLREMLSENKAFLAKTQALSERALGFMTQAVPALSKLDGGDRSAATLAAAGDAMDAAQCPTYAIYCYQAALVHLDDSPTSKAQLRGRIDTLLKNLPAPAAEPK